VPCLTSPSLAPLTTSLLLVLLLADDITKIAQGWERANGFVVGDLKEREKRWERGISKVRTVKCIIPSSYITNIDPLVASLIEGLQGWPYCQRPRQGACGGGKGEEVRRSNSKSYIQLSAKTNNPLLAASILAPPQLERGHRQPVRAAG